MLEKSGLQEEKIITYLINEYGLAVTQVTFLPLGADQNTAVYRADTKDGTAYFLKLRRGAFDEISVALPKFLSSQGIEQIIAPLETKGGQPWGRLEAFKSILYPFVEGRDGYEVALTARQWVEFGETVRRFHTVEAPPELLNRIRRETYSPRWREMVTGFLKNTDQGTADDQTAKDLRATLKDRQAVILDLIERASRYAEILQSGSQQLILCHSDLHPGNLHISPDGSFYIVDWDDPILAPKERDLMFIGGGQGFARTKAEEEEAWFYQGYGPVQIDRMVLAYYRYERIVEDIALFCEQILSSDEGDKDRKQALHYLQSNFLPGNTIEMAYRGDPEI